MSTVTSWLKGEPLFSDRKLADNHVQLSPLGEPFQGDHSHSIDGLPCLPLKLMQVHFSLHFSLMYFSRPGNGVPSSEGIQNKQTNVHRQTDSEDCQPTKCFNVVERGLPIGNLQNEQHLDVLVWSPAVRDFFSFFPANELLLPTCAFLSILLSFCFFHKPRDPLVCVCVSGAVGCAGRSGRQIKAVRTNGPHLRMVAV